MAKKAKFSDDEGPKKITLYTISLDDAQMEKLKEYCDYRLWEFFAVDYARFAFKNKMSKVNVVAYKSGKLVISGKGTEDFVRDVLEAEITGDPRLGYDEVHHPEWFEAHAGLDEAGKGDLFGPVVCATVIADGDIVRKWMEEGVRDSKKLSDSQILRLDKIIRRTRGAVVKTAFCGMGKYNQLMSRPQANLNKLMAWLHARALAEALQKKEVPWGMLDQFSKQLLVQKALKEKGVKFDLQMRTHAESDPVVAAASIVARAEFVRQILKLSKDFGEELKKGAGALVKAQAGKLIGQLGPDALGDFAKLHFKTSYEVLGLPVPVKKTWVKY